jgi:hypothetical protein
METVPPGSDCRFFTYYRGHIASTEIDLGSGSLTSLHTTSFVQKFTFDGEWYHSLENISRCQRECQLGSSFLKGVCCEVSSSSHSLFGVTGRLFKFSRHRGAWGGCRGWKL